MTKFAKNVITDIIVPVSSMNELRNVHTPFFRECAEKLIEPTNKKVPVKTREWVIAGGNGFIDRKRREFFDVVVAATTLNGAIKLALAQVKFKQCREIVVSHIAIVGEGKVF